MLPAFVLATLALLFHLASAVPTQVVLDVKSDTQRRSSTTTPSATATTTIRPHPTSFPRRNSTEGWLDPKPGGGSMIDFTTKRRGEPLNVIISGKSDESVLTHEGLRAYSKSIGFSSECFGLHYGKLHEADLGDGLGRREEQYLARQWFFHPIYGTCWESLAGGMHFRAWKQNGTHAYSNAWFLGVSKELYIGKRHVIADDGYNQGRDWLLSRAVAGGSWAGMGWKADIEWIDDLLEPGHGGINHGIDQDGRVAVLTVHRAPIRSWDSVLSILIFTTMSRLYYTAIRIWF